MDHADAGQIFPGNEVDVIRQLLHALDPRQNDEDDDKHQGQQRHDKARRDHGQRPALVDDLDDRPHGHDRGLDHGLHAHGNEHLDLRDIIRRAVDEARHGEFQHLLLTEVSDLLEHAFADVIAEACRDLCIEIAAEDGHYRADERAGQHLKAGVQHVRNGTARRFDLHGQIAHIIRQAEVKVDLAQNKCNAQQRHDPLFRLHLFE